MLPDMKVLSLYRYLSTMSYYERPYIEDNDKRGSQAPVRQQFPTGHARPSLALEAYVKAR